MLPFKINSWNDLYTKKINQVLDGFSQEYVERTFDQEYIVLNDLSKLRHSGDQL